MARPGNGFQALGIDLRLAGNTLAKSAFPNAVQRRAHHLQELALGVALVEQEFLVVGISGAVGDVLGRFHIGLTAVLRGPSHSLPQLALAVLQSFLENFQLLLIHRYPPYPPLAWEPRQSSRRKSRWGNGIICGTAAHVNCRSSPVPSEFRKRIGCSARVRR